MGSRNCCSLVNGAADGEPPRATHLLRSLFPFYPHRCFGFSFSFPMAGPKIFSFPFALRYFFPLNSSRCSTGLMGGELTTVCRQRPLGGPTGRQITLLCSVLLSSPGPKAPVSFFFFPKAFSGFGMGAHIITGMDGYQKVIAFDLGVIALTRLGKSVHTAEHVPRSFLSLDDQCVLGSGLDTGYP
ncbi:hypothetical protein VTI74DRAFT_9055 [Chaetomium olivicolor]